MAERESRKACTGLFVFCASRRQRKEGKKEKTQGVDEEPREVDQEPCGQIIQSHTEAGHSTGRTRDKFKKAFSVQFKSEEVRQDQQPEWCNGKEAPFL